MRKSIALAVTLISCFLCHADTLTRTDIDVAVERGQQTVSLSALPLVCLTIATEKSALPIHSFSIQNVDTHEQITAKLGKKFGHSEAEVLTANKGNDQSLSMAILSLTPGRYWLIAVDFDGPHRSAITVSLCKPTWFFFTVKPECANYVGSVLISIDWNSYRQGSIEHNGRYDIAPLVCHLTIEETAKRDEKWAANVVPGMAHLPSVESTIQMN